MAITFIDPGQIIMHSLRVWIEFESLVENRFRVIILLTLEVHDSLE